MLQFTLERQHQRFLGTLHLIVALVRPTYIINDFKDRLEYSYIAWHLVEVSSFALCSLTVMPRIRDSFDI